ncbi:MAG TPA: hypothetical protein VG603_15100 [Chitinophagales bacterium]|nr:hypothetical protein [Chitinophagales bacterium]
MKFKNLFRNIREYENLHIALWLIKDTCWVISFKVLGMLMIIPTLTVAIHLAWRSRKNIGDLFHNIAVCLWITANATWMTGEFFYHDSLRPYAMIFFSIGLVIVTVYYTIHFWKNAKIDETTALEIPKLV